MKHFLTTTDFDKAGIGEILELAAQLKAERGSPSALRPLQGQSWGMLFYKNSTRTRISFEVGLSELGAHPVILDATSMQLSRGESIADTARVLSRYLHGLIIRCYDHELLEGFAREGSIPIVNALSDDLHPCQIYADLFTLAERWGKRGSLLSALQGRRIVFMGDTACNMANSWLLGGASAGMHVTLCGPQAYAPGKVIVDEMAARGWQGSYNFTTDAEAAVKGADVVYTDVWVSMGDEAEADTRRELFVPYQVTEQLMSLAAKDALFMHCLPAHPGEEVTQAVIDAPQSVIYDQAENRLHAQKAVLAKLG